MDWKLHATGMQNFNSKVNELTNLYGIAYLEFYCIVYLEERWIAVA